MVTSRQQAAGRLWPKLDYVGSDMLNALRGSRRQRFHDPFNGRDVDVCVGEFAMWDTVPIADRVDRHAYTIPIAELLLTKLQLIELTDRDERDIYTLCYQR